MQRLAEIQAAIREAGLDGWLLYDFRGTNAIPREVAGIPASRHFSRRWACFIPPEGSNRAGWCMPSNRAASAISPPICRRTCRGSNGAKGCAPCWRVPARGHGSFAGRSHPHRQPRGCRNGRPRCAAWGSRCSRQPTWCRWPWRLVAGTTGQPSYASEELMAVKGDAFAHVRQGLAAGQAMTEIEYTGFHDGAVRPCAGSIPHGPPIVGINAHAADPHFSPVRETDTTLHTRRLLLLDLWARGPSRSDLRRYHLGGLCRHAGAGTHAGSV